MNSRLKEIRLKLGLSQKKFGDKMFLSQDQISLLENGKRNITDRTLNDICRTFNVNEEWLRNGDGDMFITNLTQQLGVELVRIFNKGDDLTKKLILGLSELDENEIEIVKILVDGLINKKKQSD